MIEEGSELGSSVHVRIRLGGGRKKGGGEAQQSVIYIYILAARERGYRDRARASLTTQMTHSFPPMVYTGPDNSFLVDNGCGCFSKLSLLLPAHDASYMRGRAYIKTAR